MDLACIDLICFVVCVTVSLFGDCRYCTVLLLWLNAM